MRKRTSSWPSDKIFGVSAKVFFGVEVYVETGGGFTTPSPHPQEANGYIGSLMMNSIQLCEIYFLSFRTFGFIKRFLVYFLVSRSRDGNLCFGVPGNQIFMGRTQRNRKLPDREDFEKNS